MLKKLIELFIKTNGRNPNTLEMLQLKFKAARLSGKGKVIEFPKDRITDWTKSRPSLTKVKTSKDKIDWLVKNVDPNAEQTIPPKETLEAMLRDGREDLIDHFFEMHTKKLSGKPKINIDTSGLKHPELVKKIITDKKLKPNLVKTETQIKSGIEAGNKAGIQKMKVDKLRKDVLKEIENRKNQDYIGNIIDPEDYGFKVSDGTLTDEVEEIMQMLMRDNKAGGGIAGMLGEPTFQDEDHRIPLKKGKTPGEVLDPDWDAENPEHMNLILKLLLAGEIPQFAGGGRVPLRKGGLLLEQLLKLMDKFYPGTTKLGQTSRPMAEKTQLKKSIADFLERQKEAKALKSSQQKVLDYKKKLADENKIIDHSGNAPKAGEGRFTKAEVMIMRLENSIKAEQNRKKKDEVSKYVLETFPKWVKELRANPELAKKGNAWANIMDDLPKNQQFVVYGDDTVDFFTQTKFGPHNIASKKAFHQKHPYLTEKEAIKISTMEPTDQVMELKRLEILRRTKNASGGLAEMLGE